MYYIWDRALYGNKKAFICKLENFYDTDNLIHHNEELNIPSEGLKYNAFDNNIEPEDYPMTDTIFHFLVSNRIVEILKSFSLNIQYFSSKIIRNDGKEYNDYATINILSVVNCTDMEKSETKVIKLSNKTITKVNRIILDESKIPDNEKLFYSGLINQTGI